MNRVLSYISLKTLVLIILAILCVILAGVLEFTKIHMKRDLIDQGMAERWSTNKDAAHISAFYVEGAVENSSYFRGIGVELDQALVTSSITPKTENEEARLWIDAVSRGGKVSLVSDLGKAEINAIGVKGEFFQFHPLLLVNGTYISEANPMKDGIMIDENTAWQLFGSSDVTGMQVTINGVPHIIIGVFKRPEGRIQEAAGLEKSICFLGIDSLEKYGNAKGGYFYEIVLPNPIKGFGLSMMSQLLKAETMEVKIVENSSRYQLLPLLKVIQNFGTRSMSSQSILYPYWENIAKGYEDIFALFLVIKTVLLIYPLCMLVVVSIQLYRRKTWSVAGILHWLGEKHYEMGTKKMIKKQEKERQEEVEENEKI